MGHFMLFCGWCFIYLQTVKGVSLEHTSWKIGFGSCLHQSMQAPTLIAAAKAKPDLWVWLGDNIYHDISKGGLVELHVVISAKSSTQLLGVMCEPESCSGYFSDFKSYIGMKLFTVLWDLPFSHEWARAFLSKLLKDHNHGDSESDLLEIQRNYQLLGEKDEFVMLKKAVPNQLATWDDHDYCRNDAGSSCNIKEQSKALFLSFWRGNSSRGDRDGVYESYNYSIPASVTRGSEFSVQVIVLDTRYFRTPLIYRDDVLDEQGFLPAMEGEETCGVPEWCRTPWDFSRPGEYCAHTSESKKAINDIEGATVSPSVLGDEQWEWLEEQLALPGFDLRVIASSITVLPSYNGLEAWSLFPKERQRLLDLVVNSNQDGIMFISGDVHYAELSSVTFPHYSDMYPLFEVTSSGLTMAESVLEIMPNSNRIKGTAPVGGPGGNNWGVLEVDFSSSDRNPLLKFNIMNAGGEVVESSDVQLSDISRTGASN